MYLPGGRLGNMISSFLMMLWVKLESSSSSSSDFVVYLDKESHKVMGRYFENLEMPVLEESLCDYK
jgi:hypothetical protein